MSKLLDGVARQALGAAQVMVATQLEANERDSHLRLHDCFDKRRETAFHFQEKLFVRERNIPRL